MILSGDTIRSLDIIQPCEEAGKQSGMSYGLGPAGYDIRVAMPAPLFGYGQVLTPHGSGILLAPGQGVLLGTRELFNMHPLVLGFVKDKSTWARRGLLNAQAVVEPGWRGHLSVFVSNRGDEELAILDGDPIAQVVFHWLDKLPNLGYTGKYQDQGEGPQPAKFD